MNRFLAVRPLRTKYCRLASTICLSFRPISILRSEEHTSELQSQSNLVCRLLLEKNNEAPAVAVLWSGSDFRSTGRSMAPNQAPKLTESAGARIALFPCTPRGRIAYPSRKEETTM